MTEADGSGLREFVSAYVVEVEEHLENATAQLLAIETAGRSGGANLRAIREAFRALHTIKGLSAMVGVEHVVSIAHRMEALLRSADRGASRLAPAAIDSLLDGVRAIKLRVRALATGAVIEPPDPELMRAIDELEGAPAEGAVVAELSLEPALASRLGALELEQLKSGLAERKRVLQVTFVPSAEKSERGVNINVVREQIQHVAELVKVFPMSAPASSGSPAGLRFVMIVLTSSTNEEVARAAEVEPSQVEQLAQPTAEAPVVAPDAARLEVSAPEGDLDELLPQRAVVRVDVARLDDTVEGLSALIVTRFRLSRAVKALRERGADTRELEEIVTDNARQLRTLRASILRVRMVPVSELLERIPLIVRSMQRSMNRQVRLELEAGGAEIDKAVAERLFPALVHLVRNAVDHAIETPDERERRGKPPEGLVRIECASRSNRFVELRVTDDGRGIDRAAVARRAQQPVPDTDAGLLELVCRSGLSTRDVATVTSGRGMGMEIVKRVTTEQLGGELSLQTEVGVGTTFSLQVPLTISVVDAFSFICAGQRFVTPVSGVEEIIEVDQQSVVEASALPGQAAVRLVRRRGRAVPLISLSELFEIPKTAPELRALVVRRGPELLAFGIERMLGQEEIVVRPLNDALVKVPGVAGATDLGDGKPTLVLDLSTLGGRLTRRSPELSA